MQSRHVSPLRGTSNGSRPEMVLGPFLFWRRDGKIGKYSGGTQRSVPAASRMARIQEKVFVQPKGFERSTEDQLARSAVRRKRHGYAHVHQPKAFSRFEGSVRSHGEKAGGMTILQAIEPPETELTGGEIIEDAANRLAEALSRSRLLTETCAYRSYSGKITAELQLEDFDRTKVTASAVVSNPDPARPSVRFEVAIPNATPSAVSERGDLTTPSLERMPAQEKRFYTPHQPRQRSSTNKNRDTSHGRF